MSPGSWLGLDLVTGVWSSVGGASVAVELVGGTSVLLLVGWEPVGLVGKAFAADVGVVLEVGVASLVMVVGRAAAAVVGVVSPVGVVSLSSSLLMVGEAATAAMGVVLVVGVASLVSSLVVVSELLEVVGGGSLSVGVVFFLPPVGGFSL